MSIVKYYCIVLTLVWCAVQIGANFHCGIRKHAFIPLVYHGWTVEAGQWPWHVGIFHRSPNETKYACGGTLIDPRYVLTAAHCVVNRRTNYPLPKEDVLLHFGQNDLATVERHLQVRDVGIILLHPEFSTHRNDIALLELRLPVELTEYVIPICLDSRADKDLRNLEGQRGWITGWGMTQNGTYLSELRSASLLVVSYLECFQNEQTLFGNLLNKNVFCAGDLNGTSPGTGDSGGGMYFSEGDRWILRGVVSFAKMDESRLRVDPSKFAVFVNVQRFLTWIREITEDQRSNPAAAGDSERISAKECERFKRLAVKRNNGFCSNSRYPHTVSFVNPEGRLLCTGTLVNENHVLTACHCRSSDRSMVQISDYGTVNVSSFVCHPEFSSRRHHHHHDLAVARLDSPVQLSYDLIPACLASNWTENLYDILLTTGFRISVETYATKFFESDANQMATKDECNRIKSFTASPDHLCVINNDRLPTRGSSGSPLQNVNTRTCMFTMVGILIAGNASLTEAVRGKEDTTLDVFIRVPYHLDWIEEIVWGKEVVAPTTTTEEVAREPTTTTVRSPPVGDFVFPTD